VKKKNPDGSEVIPYMHTLKLYFEFFYGWRCSLHGELSYCGL